MSHFALKSVQSVFAEANLGYQNLGSVYVQFVFNFTLLAPGILLVSSSPSHLLVFYLLSVDFSDCLLIVLFIVQCNPTCLFSITFSHLFDSIHFTCTRPMLICSLLFSRSAFVASSDALLAKFDHLPTSSSLLGMLIVFFLNFCFCQSLFWLCIISPSSNSCRFESISQHWKT